MVALVHPVFDCLMRLAKPDALLNEEEVMKNELLFTFMLFIHFYWLDAYLVTHISPTSHVKACVYLLRVQYCGFLLGDRVPDVSSTSLRRWTAWCCSCIASESSWKRRTASGWTSCSSCFGTASSCRGVSPPWPVCCCWRSWSSELVAGCSAALRTSTTTVK